jgi:hypothetical protein
VSCTGATPATIGIGAVSHLLQLLDGPRRLREQAERPSAELRELIRRTLLPLANRGDLLLSSHHTYVSGASPLPEDLRGPTAGRLRTHAAIAPVGHAFAWTLPMLMILLLPPALNAPIATCESAIMVNSRS